MSAHPIVHTLGPRTDGPHTPRDHFVQFYEEDAVLIESVHGFVAAGLAEGAGAVLIATRAHLDALEQKLKAGGIDLESARERGQYRAFDAAETLSRLLLDGRPQARRFAEVIEPLIANATRSYPRVIAFGEMVALLWQQAQYGAAIHLETLWNELANRHAFTLLCAYPLDKDEEAPVDALQNVCAVHQHVIPAKSDSGLASSVERLDTLCELQNKARRLEQQLIARKGLERQLARRERELADFLENSLQPLHMVDAEGTVLWANRAELEMLGYAAEEYVGRPITEFHVDAEAINQILASLLAGEVVRDAPARLRCRNGDTRHVLINANALWEDGKFLHSRCFTRDVTERMRAEEARALAAAIVDSSDDAIVSKTLEGTVTSWNRGAARIFGYSAEEMIGRSITTIIPPELHDEERQLLSRLSRGEHIEHYETARLTRDGRRLDISLSLSPVRDSHGVIVGASKVGRDISERKRVERALREGEEALREADRRKDEFLALLAHELRNPLAPIRYALSIAKKPGRTPEQQKRASEVIERQVAHMSHLLDDLLDVSRITRGTLELKKSSTELTVALGAAIEAARPILDAKRHTLLLDLPRDAVRLEADPVRLTQIFSNLLINAAKYTDPGGRIELQAAKEGNRVVVKVRDNGIGLSAEMMPRLFTMFAQAQPAIVRSEGGLGIGLALVRGLVELHGGTIAAHSEGPGRGSEFVVRVPIGTDAAETSDALADEPRALGASLRVLVADDNQDSAVSCGTFLELCGHKVQVAHSGPQALQVAQQFRPHVVLLDIGMPGMDGYEVATRIRAAPWGRRMTLVAVTGWGQERDRERAMQAGFDHHLTKPVDPALLEPLMQEFRPH